MFVFASDIVGKPILSLQSGHPVAKVASLLINPDTLELVALFCSGNGWRKSEAALLLRDVRDIMRDGIIIDSPEDITNVSEIVRLQSLIERKFNLAGATVVTEAGHKLGTVEDFTIDTTSYKVQKLYLKQSVIKNFLLNNLIIDRSQIVDVASDRITVKDTSVTASGLAPQPIPGESS